MRLRVALVVVALVAGSAACGVADGGPVTVIDPDDVPYGLNQTTTSSSTSTTGAPTTTGDSRETTTTISTELVELYMRIGSTQQLQPITLQLSRPASVAQILAALQEFQPSAATGSAGLRNVLPRSDRAPISVTEQAGTARVNLPRTIFDDFAGDGAGQRVLFAQIVLTLTRSRGIGRVTFTLAGDPTAAIRGDGSITAAGEAVSRDDYLSMVAGSPATTTPATAPGTTATIPTGSVPASAPGLAGSRAL